MVEENGLQKIRRREEVNLCLRPSINFRKSLSGAVARPEDTDRASFPWPPTTSVMLAASAERSPRMFCRFRAGAY